MCRLRLLLLLLLGVSELVQAATSAQLVFGSFARRENAEAFALRLNDRLDRADIAVKQEATPAGLRFRVLTAPLTNTALSRLQANAAGRGLSTWVLRTTPVAPKPGLSPPVETSVAERSSTPAAVQPEQNGAVRDPASRTPESVAAAGAIAPASEVVRAPVESSLDRFDVPGDFRLDLAFEGRAFVDEGLEGQSRWQPSVSGLVDWQRQSRDERHSVTFKGFYRLDGQDDERTHGDLREGFYRFVGDRFELSLGMQQVFWGVSEFNHVVDVVNQTDLVENIDFEDKLGQPLAMLSLQRRFGLFELLAMPGFRERTFPGEDGRLRFTLPMLADDPSYASSDEDRRLDGALRWSHYVGPLNVGLSHFSGTNRDPQFRLVTRNGGQAIRPHYTTIDQTGLDAQWLAGDLNLRLELVSRSGDGDRYTAGNVGFERTFVGIGGGRTDLGLVLEYLFDDRGGRATNTIFEQDIALGLRFAFNDVGSSDALFGVIWDRKTDERVFSVEASRQLGVNWLLGVEGRAFDGVDNRGPIGELIGFLNGDAKSAFLVEDDYLQLELRRYF